MTTEELVELITAAVPYSNQIREWDWTSETQAVRFTWRGTRFRATTSLLVEEVQPPFLNSTDIAILLEALLKKADTSLPK